MQQASESHEKAVEILKQQLQDLQKQMESTLQGDTDTKLQRILDQKCYLEKEVESLNTVLEFKVADILRLRKENLEMQEEIIFTFFIVFCCNIYLGFKYLKKKEI
ncbi:uncharacterized protein LOC143244409 isoform X2 [Tachypleus tridentatus]|uniref:uncharacterized protein LOC143244409 isoform X2 n=1 Tax=Tachypleus tridentatus TaxID=6853 RepID=UPI003FD2622E